MLLIYFILGTALCQSSYGLYEDQIGKFDWKKNFVGEVKYSIFDSSINLHEKVYVATEQNVVAALSLENGDIKWRNILEKGDYGSINLLHIINNVVFTVSGNDIVIVRGWDAKNGYLTHQWSIQLPIEESEQVLWYAEESLLHLVLIKLENVINIVTYRIYNGEITSERSISSTSVSSSDKCSLSKEILFCLNSEGQVKITNLVEGNAVPLSDNVNEYVEDFSPKESLATVKSSLNDHKSVFVASNDNKKFAFVNLSDKKFDVTGSAPLNGDISMQLITLDTTVFQITVQPVSRTVFEVNGYLLNPKRTVYSNRYSSKYPIGNITISNANCFKQMSGVVSCNVLLTTSDGSLIFLKSPGKVEWIREEGLSSIISAEMIELPVSDTEGEMQTEFEAEELFDYVRQAAGIFGMFTHRITSHVTQLQKAVLSIVGILEKSFSVEHGNESKLVRDYFNLHKIILVITKHMKIYAIDNISKEILWSYLISDEYEPFPAPSENFDVRIPLYIQRSYRHYPHPMELTILVRNRITKNAVIINFNPVSGVFNAVTKLDYKIKQALLIPKATEDDYLLGLLLLDEDNTAHVYPERTLPTLLEVARSMYIYVADAETCDVNGYTFGPDVTNMTLVPVWNMKCSGKIIKLSGKNPIEKVHSLGRVLPDRSVLYKYINPNLIAIVSQGINPEDHKNMLTLYFVDSVTGVIVNGDMRQRASEPVHLVHSENWVALMYFNDKARRTEIVTYELYEGKTQKNSTAFSSLQTKSLRPIIDSKAYILPTAFIESAKETITEKGITSKHVLVALSSGTVVELPWIILDPRRPYASTPEMKEEGIIPYMPEIPILTESMINYNQTLHRVRSIVTSPSGLESTCLVFVYGLDLFYTRTAPSKTFDVLKEDFDYILIVIFLVILVVAAFVTKHFAYRKALKQAWR